MLLAIDQSDDSLLNFVRHFGIQSLQFTLREIGESHSAQMRLKRPANGGAMSEKLISEQQKFHTHRDGN